MSIAITGAGAGADALYRHIVNSYCELMRQKLSAEELMARTELMAGEVQGRMRICPSEVLPSTAVETLMTFEAFTRVCMENGQLLVCQNNIRQFFDKQIKRLCDREAAARNSIRDWELIDRKTLYQQRKAPYQADKCVGTSDDPAFHAAHERPI